MKVAILPILLGIFVVGAVAQTDLRKNDWAGFTYVIGGKPVSMKGGIQSGACREKDADGVAVGDVWNVDPAAVAYGDLDGDGREEAIVPLVANVCSGNMITNEAMIVYASRNGKVVRFSEVAFHDEGCASGTEGCNYSRSPGVAVAYDQKEKALVVTTSFSTADDAVCCPSLERKIWYKWDGSEFIELRRGKVVSSN